MAAKPRQYPPRFLARPRKTVPSIRENPDAVERIRDATRMCDEPEKVGPRWLEDWADTMWLERSQQHAKDVASMREIRKQLTLDDRVRDVQRRAKYAHVDMSRELDLMRRDIERAKAGNRQPPRRVDERLEGLECLLDGIEA